MLSPVSDRAALFADYLAAGQALSEAVSQLRGADLDARQSADEWCVRQIVHHVADVEVGDAMRLRLMLAHDGPLITAYDEARFAARLHYDRPIETSLAAFRTLRASNASLLERMSAGDWPRRGYHEERPLYSVEILVQKSIEHDREHLAQIQRALRSAA